MNFDNLVEIVVHLLIKKRIDLYCQDDFSMLSALACMVTHWMEHTMNHDIRLLIVTIHQATILYGLSSLRGY